MKNKDKIRKVFQTFAIILFTIQIQQSVRKYFHYPVLEQTSRVPVKDIPHPVVYVCHDNQFNHPKAREKGYKYFHYYLLGIMMNGKNISWQGENGNQTFKDLEKSLLDSDYTSTSGKFLSRSKNNWIEIDFKKTFLFPHGVCMKFENLQQYSIIKVHTTDDKTNDIYFVDPARENNVRTEETLDAKASFGPTLNTYFSTGKYELEYLVYDDSIHDGTTCTDYSRSDMSYGKCFNNVLKQEFLATYGCLPPWVTTNNSKIICEEQTNLDARAMKKTPLYDNIKELIKNYETEIFKRCLPPCKTMKIKLQEVSYNSNYLGKAKIEARSKDWATVHTQVYSYDILNLTVDLGSALGLWLGLSCLSILDHILENWILMKKYWKN